MSTSDISIQPRVPPWWAWLTNAALTAGSLAAFAFVSLPVIRFFAMSFNGMGSDLPPSRLLWSAVIFLAAAVPVASIYLSWRWLRRGAVAPGLAVGAVAPTIGALLYGVVAQSPAMPVAYSSMLMKAVENA